jgi:hypothetical protein
MEYERSIGLVTGKMIFFIAYFNVLGLFIARKRFWITEKSFHRNFLTETPFDRTPFDRMPFDRKFIRPNRRLTERRLTESSFYRKNI